MGFDAGDSNLYRYTKNKPLLFSDSSGLLESSPIYGTWIFWEKMPISNLNISGISDWKAVDSIIARIDEDFPLNKIPFVEARYPITSTLMKGKLTPSYPSVTPDKSMGIANTAFPRAKPSQLARINLRVNLLRFKQDLVTNMYLLVRDNLSSEAKGKMTSKDYYEIEVMANQTADQLIWMFDLFLRSHPGAKPNLGWTWENRNIPSARFSSPWCADWTGAMSAWIQHAITSKPEHPANKYLEFEWGQANHHPIGLEVQHNFIIFKPKGHVTQLSVPGNNFVDSAILLFDPWRELTPTLYSAIPWGQKGRRTPTDIMSRLKSNEYSYYFNNLFNDTFFDHNLRLGSMYSTK